MKGKGFSRHVTLGNIDLFRLLLRIPEKESVNKQNKNLNDENSDLDKLIQEVERLFDGRHLNVKVPFKHPKVTRHKKDIKPLKYRKNKPILTSRQLLWRKILVASDVQKQMGHPTGGLRLTQANFSNPLTKKTIDHTSYFRDLFSDFPWRVTRHIPFVEEASIQFEIFINGNDFGIYQLSISHKPSGEAGQRNYTTILKWGSIASIISQMNLIGKTFEIYSPLSEVSQPYLIIIK